MEKVVASINHFDKGEIKEYDVKVKEEFFNDSLFECSEDGDSLLRELDYLLENVDDKSY